MLEWVSGRREDECDDKLGVKSIDEVFDELGVPDRNEKGDMSVDMCVLEGECSQEIFKDIGWSFDICRIEGHTGWTKIDNWLYTVVDKRQKKYITDAMMVSHVEKITPLCSAKENENVREIDIQKPTKWRKTRLMSEKHNAERIKRHTNEEWLKI